MVVVEKEQVTATKIEKKKKVEKEGTWRGKGYRGERVSEIERRKRKKDSIRFVRGTKEIGYP